MKWDSSLTLNINAEKRNNSQYNSISTQLFMQRWSLVEIFLLLSSNVLRSSFKWIVKHMLFEMLCDRWICSYESEWWNFVFLKYRQILEIYGIHIWNFKRRIIFTLYISKVILRILSWNFWRIIKQAKFVGFEVKKWSAQRGKRLVLRNTLFELPLLKNLATLRLLE